MDCGRKNVLCIKILVIKGSVFNQNCKKNKKKCNTEMIGSKKNTNMT